MVAAHSFLCLMGQTASGIGCRNMTPIEEEEIVAIILFLKYDAQNAVMHNYTSKYNSAMSGLAA